MKHRLALLGILLIVVGMSIHAQDNPAPPDMQKMAAAGADLQSAPLNCGSVICFVSLSI